MDRSERTAEPLIASLLNAKPYSHPVNGLQLIETHISWVILTGPYAYKIKKPVDFGFLDFSTLEKRRHFCEEELRLNQRTAPSIYLEVLPIIGTVERPPHWSGFRITPRRTEFWSGGAFRLHKRVVYETPDDGCWNTSRLYP